MISPWQTVDKNFHFVLLAVPPQKLMIYDKNGRAINESVGFVGPLVEGADLLLKCEVHGGKFFFSNVIIIIISTTLIIC